MTRTLVTFTLSLLLFATGASAQNLQALQARETSDFLAGLSSAQHMLVMQTAETVAASGTDSQVVYTEVSKTISKYHQLQLQAPRDEAIANTMLALLRALGASGDPRYQSNLQEILDQSKNRGARNRAKHMMGKFDWYANRNRVMNDWSNYQPGTALITARFLNLLNSKDPVLSRWAAEEIYRQNGGDEVLIQTMMEELTPEAASTTDRAQLDRIAWFCRCAARFGNEQDRGQVRKLSEDATINAKVRKHCSNELKKVSR